MGNMMVVKDCRKFPCLKAKEVIDDFSLLEWQKGEILIELCENCKDRVE